MPSIARVMVALGFAAIGVMHLLEILRSARRPETAGRRAGQVDQVAHMLMSFEMVAMLAIRAFPDRWGAQATVLAVITGWFTVRAVGRPTQLSHALAAAAMTGMVAFPSAASGSTIRPASAAAMPGMSMPEQTSGAHLGALAGGCLLISAIWWVAAAFRAGRTSRSPGPIYPSPADKRSGGLPTGRPGWRVAIGPVTTTLAHAAMAAVMAAMLLASP
jgi:hypothetical protein